MTLLLSSKGRSESGPQEFVEEVFLTEGAALKLVFPQAERIEKKVHRLTGNQKKAIESRLGWTVSESSVTIHQGFAAGQPQGWAMVAEEIGKFKPITFMVKVSNEGKVERVEVMVYRESVGSEVRRERFTRQFRGKTAKDPLRINRDIINLTGATMSVQALSGGVKKALTIIDQLYLRK